MARTTVIDQFGRPQNSINFGSPHEPLPYKIKSSGSTTYVCFFDTPKRAIHRITENGGEKTVELAYGEWENAAALTYAPINSNIEVEI